MDLGIWALVFDVNHLGFVDYDNDMSLSYDQSFSSAVGRRGLRKGKSLKMVHNHKIDCPGGIESSLGLRRRKS
jgi:hypothetical protein